MLWFRLSRQPGDYWQCAFVIGKGSLAALRERGLESLRDRLSRALGFPQQRMMELATWDELKLLTVQVNRLARWACEGLLCIGDAAHAMSPVGGVGINLAIQDAVAAANRLHGEFRAGGPSLAALAGVQRWRDFPTRFTQRFQLLVQSNILQRVLGRYRLLRSIPARMIGMGVRPEHIASPAVAA